MANETTTNATETVEAEVYVMIGEDGQYTCHTDPDALAERFADECADAGLATRVVKVTLRIPMPRPVELVGTVAAEPEGGELVAK
jgi:hypothetical protein